MEVIDVKMNEIELLGALKHLLEHQDMVRKSIDRFAQPERAWRAGHQRRSRLRIAAGKKSNVVTLSHQFFGQIRDDAFGSAITVRWNTFIKGRYLCNFHRCNVTSISPSTC